MTHLYLANILGEMCQLDKIAVMVKLSGWVTAHYILILHLISISELYICEQHYHLTLTILSILVQLIH